MFLCGAENFPAPAGRSKAVGAPRLVSFSGSQQLCGDPGRSPDGVLNLLPSGHLWFHLVCFLPKEETLRVLRVGLLGTAKQMLTVLRLQVWSSAGEADGIMSSF